MPTCLEKEPLEKILSFRIKLKNENVVHVNLVTDKCNYIVSPLYKGQIRSLIDTEFPFYHVSFSLFRSTETTLKNQEMELIRNKERLQFFKVEANTYKCYLTDSRVVSIF